MIRFLFNNNVLYCNIPVPVGAAMSYSSVSLKFLLAAPTVFFGSGRFLRRLISEDLALPFIY